MTARNEQYEKLSETLPSDPKDDCGSEDDDDVPKLPPLTGKLPLDTAPKKESGYKIGKQVMKIRRPENDHTQIINVSELHGHDADVKDAFEDLDMDEIIDYVGAEGKYQYILIGQAALLSVVMSMILYAASYLLASPDFYCGAPTVIESKCLEKDWCSKNFFCYQ